jgi:hypothetical protein
MVIRWLEQKAENSNHCKLLMVLLDDSIFNKYTSIWLVNLTVLQPAKFHKFNVMEPKCLMPFFIKFRQCLYPGAN